MKKLSKLPAPKSGLGKQIVKIVVSLLKDILITVVSNRLRRIVPRL
ncbi:hypothetical protein HDC92_002508 [Pedobacter sp. AK017]|nr:hypothetical protein [Pedobacter sp. AK017]